MSSKSHSVHILPLSTYLTVGSGLLALTLLTVFIASVDFGAYNLVIAMAIAAFKASLVALIFMHLKYDNKLYSLVFLGSLAFLAIFIVITMFDTLRRADIYEIKGDLLNPNAVIYDKVETAKDAENAALIVDSSAIKDHSVTIDSTTK